MTTEKKTILPPPLEPGQRILGLDFGRKRVGIAVSDNLLLLAHGRATLRYHRQQELLQHVHALRQSENVGLIVIGLPQRMNGEDGEMTAQVKQFAARLQAELPIPVRLWDERLSSRQAERLLAASEPRKQRDKGAIDQVAAVLILQSYLDSLAFTQKTA